MLIKRHKIGKRNKYDIHTIELNGGIVEIQPKLKNTNIKDTDITLENILIKIIAKEHWELINYRTGDTSQIHLFKTNIVHLDETQTKKKFYINELDNLLHRLKIICNDEIEFTNILQKYLIEKL